MSVYKELIEAGIPIDNHESDLYALVTPVSREIVRKYELNNEICATVFKSKTDGRNWFDIPFSYAPWWEKRMEKHVEASK